MIGFSNYVWNSSLTDAFIHRIKEEKPDLPTVVGGPNFPTDNKEQKKYLEDRPWIDFYIVKEGEHAFVSLVEWFLNKGSQEDLSLLPNLVYTKNNFFHSSKKIERVMDLSQIPSPYLSHRLDEFLDENFTNYSN